MNAAATVRRNVVANAAGRVVTVVAGIAFIPLHLNLLGVEAFGLVGFYVLLLSLISVLDLGLSTTLNRHLARSSIASPAAEEDTDLLRTLEWFYWGVAVVIGMMIMLLAPLISTHWIDSHGLESHRVERAVRLMGLALALQWPSSLYAGGLLGLQRHGLLNLVRGAVAIVHGGGVVLVLWVVSPTIEAYLVWGALVSLGHTLLLAGALWRSLPAVDRAPRFDLRLWRSHWRFAAGMTGISALVVLLTQFDKIILSKQLPLSSFGYYALAASVAAAVGQLAGPIFATVFPRLSQLVAQRDGQELARFYHQASQLVALVIVPAVTVGALFSYELLLIWLRHSSTAGHVHVVVRLLLVGTALNCLVLLPYALQLAHGWTRLSLYKNAIAVTAVVPAMLYMTARLGGVGAALVWVALNTGYLLLEVPIMHQRLLRGELGRWYGRDVLTPVGVTLAIGLVSRLLYPSGAPDSLAVLWVAVTWAVMAAALLRLLPDVAFWFRPGETMTIGRRSDAVSG